MTAPVLQVKRGALSNLPGLRAGEPAFTTDSFDFYVGIDSTSNNNKFVGSNRYWTKGTATTGSGVRFVERTDGGSNYIELKAPDTALASNVTLVLPATQGATSSVLTNDGSGNLSWSSGSANPVFTGIATFTGTTDNILGNPDTGTLQVDGGVGINKNTTIGQSLYVNQDAYVTGLSTFNGQAKFDALSTFNAQATFNNVIQPSVGNTSAGIIWPSDPGGGGGDVAYIKYYVESGENTRLEISCQNDANDDIYLNTSEVNVSNNLNVAGNLYVAGQSEFVGIVTFRGGTINLGDGNTDDIVVAGEFKSNLTPTDDDTYNLGAAGKRWRDANFSGIVTATTFSGNATSADQVKTVDTGNTNANYYITFVNSNNGSATNETVYTDDAIYYNPGTNTFITQYGYFTGDVTVDGSIVGTASTATRATLIDTTGTSSNADYYVTFVDTLAGQTGETLRVGIGLSVNPSDGSVKTKGILSVGDPAALTSYIKAGGGSNALYLYGNGDVSFQSKAIVNEIRSSSNATTLITLSDLDATFARDVRVTGITTVGSDLFVGGDVTVTGNDIKSSTATAITLSGADVAVAGDLTVTGNDIKSSTATALTLSGANVEVKGELQVTGNIIKSSTGATVATLSANDVQFTDDVTVGGNLYVLGQTTEVETTNLKVEDSLIDLGLVQSGTTLIAPTSDLNIDIGILLNWYDGSAKKAAFYWDDSAQRIAIASEVSESSNVLTASAYAPVEIGALWVNDCAGQSQVISCTGSERFLNNITVDAGTF